VFDHMRGNLTAADLFAQGLAAATLAAAETTFPVLSAIPVQDPRPLARPPSLPRVPVPPRRARAFDAPGVLLSLGLVGLGGAAVSTARPRAPRKDARR